MGGPTPHDPYGALRLRDFRLLMSVTFLVAVGAQMIGVAVGWELYLRTNNPLALGMVGLVEVIPVLLLALPAGHIIDRYDRRFVAATSQLVVALSAFGLAAVSFADGPVALVYVCLFFVGAARAFQGPVGSALVAQVVPVDRYTNAATWQSGVWQTASVMGPALGGLLVAVLGGASWVYVLVGVMLLVAILLTALLRPRPVAKLDRGMTLDSLFAGVRFLWHSKVLLAAITLDMFAVLLGGATALLPIFARDILHVGAWGLGLLRAAPPVGAIIAALIVAHRPPFRHAGRTLLLVVAGFGLLTIAFGFSTSFPLSLALLAAMGGLDNVSVVIRSTLVLLRTPDDMRGRVNSVHYVFVGISNELGAFESGVAAALVGVVGAVVLGGLGTIAVVGVVALLWPEVRRLGRLSEGAPPAEGVPTAERV